MSLAREKVALFLLSQEDHLVRIWRAARASAEPEVFPGLIDGLVEPFFQRVAELLGAGEPAEEVWSGLWGVLRVSPSLPPSVLSAEWDLLAEVVAAAAESIGASREDGGWLARAVASAQVGAAQLATGAGEHPAGVVPVVVFSSMAPRQRAASAGDAPR